MANDVTREQRIQALNQIMESEYLTKQVNDALAFVTDDIRTTVVTYAAEAHAIAESPLETAFAAWWKAIDFLGPVARLTPQETVHIGDKNYRPDFVVRPTPSVIADAEQFQVVIPKIAIELDGHEFHERTKEQVTYRNQRDRALQSAGWLVLHFSGSEFNRDPSKCISDVQVAVLLAFDDMHNAIKGARAQKNEV